MSTLNLTPTTSHKSFYGKAKIKTFNHLGCEIAQLVSYSTVVAEYNVTKKIMTVKGWYSATTAKHINAFLEMYGYPSCSKKEMDNYGK
jgi:hypothetical protein